MILTQNFTLDIVKPPLNRLRLVNGDTANKFVVTIKNNGSAVTLDATLHKIIAVFTRADGEVYTQDASCGVTFTTAGVVTIDVRPASFRTGTNKITLQIYKRENSSATEYPLLLTTQEQTFNARAAAIPEAGAPNAPSQLPMLEQIIHDAGEAVTNCNNATAAANDAAAAANSAASAANSAASSANSAASSANNAASAANDAAAAANAAAGMLNTMLENIDAVPTQNSNNLVKSGGVYTALAGKQNTLTFDNAPTAGSNNPVKSGGIKTAIDNAVAAVAKKNFYNVKHSTATWTTGPSGNLQYQSSPEDTIAELEAIAEDAVFASQVLLQNSVLVTVYEYYRNIDEIYMKSDAASGANIIAMLNLAGSAAELTFVLHDDESPLTLHVASTTQDQSNPRKASITFAAGETDLIYAGAQTRDMEFEFELPWDNMHPTVHMRKTGFDDDGNGTLVVSFIGHYVGHTVADGFYAQAVCAVVYFINNGTYYGTIIGTET